MNQQQKQKYTLEFKHEAVKLVTEQEYKVSEAARNLGIDRSMLARWRRELTAEAAGERLSGPEREELERLRSEVKRLRMEREILKNPRRGVPLPKEIETQLSHYTALEAEGSGRLLFGGLPREKTWSKDCCGLDSGDTLR